MLKIPKEIFGALIMLCIFCALLIVKDNHFQECDSSGVYYNLKQFPQSSYTFANSINPKFADINLPESTKILILKNLEEIFPDKKEKVQVFIQNFNLISFLRAGMIRAIDAPYVPSFVKNTFAIPMSTTYPLGSGIFYSLSYEFSKDYQEFMSKSLIITIFIFLVGVFFLYRIARNVGCSILASIAIAEIYLFSTSNYSYAFHLGSTVWILTSTILWFSILTTRNISNKSVGLASLALIPFNYFISIFFFCLFLFDILKIIKKNQIIDFYYLKPYFYIMMGLIGYLILFFPFGQTLSSRTNFPTLTNDFYLTLINFFAITGDANYLITEFIFSIIILIFSIFTVIKYQFFSYTKCFKYISCINLFLIIYLILVGIGFLAFSPTRHMLFLGPIILIICAVGFSNSKIDSRTSEILSIFFIFIYGFLGSMGYFFNTIYSKNVAIIPNDLYPKARYVMVGDCSFNLMYQKYPSNLEVLWWVGGGKVKDLKSLQEIPLPLNVPILYISQTTDFSRFANYYHDKEYSLRYESKYGNKTITNKFFTATNPDNNYVDPRFFHNRPNNFYYQIFTINSN